MNHLTLGSIAFALALATGTCLSGSATAQQLQYACDENGDGLVDANEARLCTERNFDELAAGEEVLTEDRLSAKGQGEQGTIFAEVDEDGDGEVSREEWTRWHEQRFTAATQAGESGIPATDYERMEWTKEGYARPLPEGAGQSQQ